MNNIKDKINLLFDNIENSNLYKNYLEVKEMLENNKEIMDLINNIKRLQKIATNNKDDVIERKIKDLYFKLDSYPIYQSYLIIKEELNEELCFFKDSFEKYFEELLKI